MRKTTRIGDASAVPLPKGRGSSGTNQSSPGFNIDKRSHARLLGRIGRAHFNYFLKNQNPQTGLVLDRSNPASPASIAAVGFALTAYGCAVRRNWIRREDAVAYALKVLGNLWSTPQGEAAEGTSGYRGFFYHFLDPETGLRTQPPRYWKSEVSSIDTALLMAGVLFARNFFTGKSAEERKIRELADNLYRRVEWDWLITEEKLFRHGWRPETGFIPYVYKGYNEALLLYILALGSPTHPAPDGAWEAFLGGSQVVEKYGIKYVGMYGDPLFPYQYPHAWIDFRNIRDQFSTERGFDWAENSRRMALVQYRYAQENPKQLRGYGGLDWGQTACDGPGDIEKEFNGRKIQFHAYSERGAPDGFDDGTIAPTAALGSMPFVPEISIPTARHWLENRPELFSDDGGFVDAFNMTFEPDKPSGWVDSERLGIDQGPIILMIENWRSDLVWKVMHRDCYLRRGLLRAGFYYGWLTDPLVARLKTCLYGISSKRRSNEPK